MRPTVIDYYFWVNSDWAYFGNPRLRAMADRYGLAIRYHPIDFTQVFAATGGVKLAERAPERQAYRLAEMRRFGAALDMPINLKPRYPVTDARLPSLFVVAAGMAGSPVHDLLHRIMIGRWVRDEDIEAPATLLAIAGELGLPGEAIMAGTQRADTAAQYERNTRAAIERGVFGAPFYFVADDEPFWGQDRLDMLERKIAGLCA